MEYAERLVSKAEFEQEVLALDVILEIHEPYPYKTLFKLRYGELVGYEDRDGKYYICKPAN